MSQALKLHEKLKSQIKTERRITHEILMTLQEFDITQRFRELGYSSLYDYLVRGHGYSEGAANRRIQASRLLRQAPQVASKIQEGKLNLTQLALTQAAIRQEERKSGTKVSKEKKHDTLQALQGKNHFETQKLLLDSFPRFELSTSKAVPTKKKSVQVTLEFSDQDWKKIQALLAQMSHKVPDQKLESALLYWALQIEKKKQSASSARAQVAKPENHATTKDDLVHNSPPLRRQSTTKRPYIAVKTKKSIFDKAQHCCEYVSPLTGHKCDSRQYLEIDHIRPKALGGSDDKNNLRILCRAHNHLMAKQLHLNINMPN